MIIKPHHHLSIPVTSHSLTHAPNPHPGRCKIFLFPSRKNSLFLNNKQLGISLHFTSPSHSPLDLSSLRRGGININTSSHAGWDMKRIKYESWQNKMDSLRDLQECLREREKKDIQVKRERPLCKHACLATGSRKSHASRNSNQVPRI